MNRKKRIKHKYIKKSLQWLLSHALTVFPCVVIIAFGIVFLAYSSPGTTTIGENISTNNLTAYGNLEVGGNITTTGNMVVTGNTSLATTTISGGDLIVNTDTLFVDNCNNRVGIGTTGPIAKLEVYKSGEGNQFIVYGGNDSSGSVRTYPNGGGVYGIIINSYYADNSSPYLRNADFVASADTEATQMRFFTKGLNADAIAALILDRYGNGVIYGTINGMNINKANRNLSGSNTLIGNTALGGNVLANVKHSESAYNLGDENVEMGTTFQSQYNTGVGLDALRENLYGGDNTAVGAQALRDNTHGFYNSAVGHYALGANTWGWKNVAVGTFSLNDNLTGGSNTAIGFSSLSDNTTGSYNTANGRGSMLWASTGNYNTAVGFGSLMFDSTGSYNTAIGARAGYDIFPTSNTITSFTDYYSTVAGTVKATSVAHGRSTGNSLIITGTTSYNGTYSVTVIDADNFYFTKTFVTTETGWWTLAGQEATDNTIVGYDTGRGITYGSGNTILGAHVGSLAGGLTNNIIIANGTGAIKAQNDGTNWSLTGNVGIGSTNLVSELSFGATASKITTDTADNSDNKRLAIGGGGGATVNRGAYILLAGNENTSIPNSPGVLQLRAGGVTGSYIDFSAADTGATQMVLNKAGNLGIGTTLPATTLDVNGIIRTQPRSTATCNTNVAGGIYYDSDDNHFYGCNGTVWIQLDN